MTKNKILAKNTIILTIGQFIPKLIAIITFIFYRRLWNI